ncbi:MAG TPA: Gfo/Idh/MocA family oxidoreductase [Clostridia bacterium]|nr:Gfo/Idh/MocA family oxidoreductase [Clostridia bacterium]
MGNIRLGVIGCGEIAKSMLLVCKLTRGISVSALCDINEDRLNKQGRRFKKAKLFTDYNEMLSVAEIDAVYIALPHYLHYPVMKRALESNKHILCEKPITIKEEDALDVVSEARERNLKIAVNYQYRYDNNCYRLVNAVRDGHLGHINFIRCSVPWYRDESYFVNAPWHASLEKSGGGTLLTQGSHLLDIILWMADSGIEEVRSTCRKLKFTEAETEDFCTAELRLQNGTLVQFMSTMASPVEEAVRLEVFGSNGYGEYIKKLGSKVRFKGVRPPAYKYGRPAVHAVQKGLRDFRDSIISGKKHLCSGEDAIEVLRAVNQIYGSSEGVYREGVSKKEG